MRSLLTREAVRQVDQDAIERLGVPGVVLMENAGRGAFDALRERFPDRLGQVLLLGGPGQNGGDAWVVARHLHCHGVPVHCLLVGARARVGGDARVNLRALEALGVAVSELTRLDDLKGPLAHAGLVVDGLFGTGLDRPVDGLFAQVIDAVAGTPTPVLALDLPSGVDANTGAVLGTALPATMTVTFAALKRGLFQYPGARLAGEVRCVSIGVPVLGGAPARLIEPRSADWLPLRPADAHKGRAGHVLVVAGSPGTTGAALLAARGAYRGGAGLVTLAPRGEAYDALAGRVLEAMTLRLPTQALQAVDAVLQAVEGKASAIVGPGLGTDEAGTVLARALVRALPIPCVVDADALTAHAGDLQAMREAAGPRVLTPHPGEAGRLLGWSTAQVQADRFAAAAALARASGQVVVLKGAGSLVASPEGDLGVCERGTPALGVAGTGDVLSGVVAACLVELPPFDAARVATWLHARAGEIASDTDRGLLASEVADAIPRALAETRS